MDLLLEPQAWLVVILLTILGTAGNLALYELGKQGTKAVFQRFPRIRTERWEKVGRLYEQYGARVLALSAVPVLGSLVTTAAGAFGIKRLAFLFWVILAKLLRNWLLAVILYELYYHFTG